MSAIERKPGGSGRSRVSWKAWAPFPETELRAYRSFDLVGARYCPQPGLSRAPHVHYTSGERHASVFLVAHGVRFTNRFAGTSDGHSVRLLHVAGVTMAIVAHRE